MVETKKTAILEMVEMLINDEKMVKIELLNVLKKLHKIAIKLE